MLQWTTRSGFLAFNRVFPILAACPRRAEPRLRVPAGSVGIGGRQTGIYPLPTLGGWQLIGHTSLPLFDPFLETPVLLAPVIPCALCRKRGRLLTIVRAGIHTSVQDSGRYGLYQPLWGT